MASASLPTGPRAMSSITTCGQTAAAEGISVFVAAGDSGSASCDDGNACCSSPGLTVSGLASTPWNTAVGGTDFNWCNPDTANGSAATECTAAPYWSSTAIKSPGSTQAVTTALGYVPETPWNESCTNPLTLKWVQDAANIRIRHHVRSQGLPIPNRPATSSTITTSPITRGSEGLAWRTYPYLTYLIEDRRRQRRSQRLRHGIRSLSTPPPGNDRLQRWAPPAPAATSNPDTGASQASLTLVNNGWPKPSWQTGVGGIPSDGVRDLPDVSFFAADGYVSSSAYLICVSAAQSNTPCTYSSLFRIVLPGGWRNLGSNSGNGGHHGARQPEDGRGAGPREPRTLQAGSQANLLQLQRRNGHYRQWLLLQ